MLKRDDRAVKTATSDRVIDLALPPTSPPQLVVVSGHAGSGRTTLLREVVARLQRTPVWLDCSVFSHRRPLRSLHEALSSTSPQVFPTEMAGVLADQLVDPPPDLDDIGALVWSVISGAHQLEGQVVVLDDFHLLDPASQQVAGYALRRLAQFGGVPVLLSVERGAEWTDPRASTVDLDGLTTDQVRVLAEDLVGAPVPYRVADRLQVDTGGNVLAVVEVLSHLTSEQLEGRDLLPRPLRLGRSVARRLLRAHGREEPQHVVLLAALAIDPLISPELARRLSGTDPGSTLEDALTDGVIEHTRRGVRAQDPAEALAAWQIAPSATGLRVHGVLADGPDPACSTVHRALSGEESVSDELFAAAVECHRLGLDGHVSMMLDAVGWALPAEGFAVAQQLMADGYLASVRRIVDAPTSPEAASADQLDTLRSRLAILSGHVRDGLAEPPDLPSGSDADQWGRTVLGTVRGLIHREDLLAARHLLDRSAAGLAVTSPALQALARFVRAELGYQRREEWSLTELSRAAADWLACQQGEDDPISVSIMVFYLLAVGNPALAGAILNRTEPSVDTASLARVAHLVGRVQTEVVWGHYVTADHLISAMDRILPYADGGSHTIGLVVAVSAARGADPVRDRIEWRLDHPDLGGQPPHARSEVAAANGLRCLVEGAYGQALALLDQALRSRSALFTGATAVLASLLEVNRALGATAGQNRALRAGLGAWWPDRYGERFGGLEARCDALCADDEGLDEAFRSALDRSSADFPIDVARTHLAYGRCLLQLGRIQDADEQLERAEAVFANERLHGWIAHIQRLRARPSASSPAAEAGLSPTERDIVALVLERRTNAEIARSLFMSKRSIELHLTRVFRKLGVARKSQLIELDAVRELVQGPVTR